MLCVEHTFTYLGASFGFAAISVCSMHDYGSLKLINAYISFEKTPTYFGTELLSAESQLQGSLTQQYNAGTEILKCRNSKT